MYVSLLSQPSSEFSKIPNQIKSSLSKLQTIATPIPTPMPISISVNIMQNFPLYLSIKPIITKAKSVQMKIRKFPHSVS